MPFIKATKSQAKARVAWIGIPGSGKTWTALMWARVLAGPAGRVALIDTENASASKYADVYDFDTLVLSSFTPRSYIAAIREAEAAGYDVLVIDSLSHGWAGKDGVLAMVDHATSRAKSNNAFTTGWREVTPEHNALVDALVQCKCHLICTMRAKAEWVIDDVNGRKVPRKLGMAPVQREGLEFEFDLVADFDSEHKMVVSKSRCPALADGVYGKPGPDIAEKLAAWLSDGATVVKADPPAPPAPPAAVRPPAAPVPAQSKPQSPPPAPPVPATQEQVAEMVSLCGRVPDETVEKWFAKAGIERWDDMDSGMIQKCIDYAQKQPQAAAA